MHTNGVLFAQENVFASIDSAPAPEGLQIGDLNPCRALSSRPELDLQINGEPATQSPKTLNVDQPIHIAALHSGVRQALLLYSLKEREAPLATLNESAADFLPPRVGPYAVVAVSQNQQDACSVLQAQFQVTANPDFDFDVSPTLEVRLDDFRHLAQAHIPEAWRESTGRGILIALIDSGLNYLHPNLKHALAWNNSELSMDGQDSDGNGLIDDALGYDFVNDDPFAFDDSGHGSHLAGLMAGSGFGVAQEAKIIPIKAMSSFGGDLGTLVAALYYAAEKRARIINLSLGALNFSQAPIFQEAVDFAEARGILIVTASGNGDPASGLGFSIDEIPVYPASFTNSNVLTVAAADFDNPLSPYSNFGKESVDLTAPGGLFQDQLRSTASAADVGEFSYLYGTSQAAALVTGSAALLLAKYPDLKPAEISLRLMNSGELRPELESVIKSSRELNALSALLVAIPSTSGLVPARIPFSIPQH